MEEPGQDITESEPSLEIPTRPNFVVVVLDTVRFDAVSLSGGASERTPHIANLAATGVSFLNAYSTWDETRGSHFSLFTGFATGLQSDLHNENWSVAHQLKQRGYSTFGVAANLNLSKQSMPVLRSFDDYLCLGDEWNELEPDQKAALTPELDSQITRYNGVTNDFNRLMMYCTSARTLEVFGEQLGRATPPFFGFINLMEAHDPYFPSPDNYDHAAEEAAFPETEQFSGDLRNRPIPDEISHPGKLQDAERRKAIETKLAMVGGRAWSTTFDLDPQDLDLYRRRYAARVREADARLGEVIEVLRARGLLDSTILIVTSDHGESFGEDDLITHAFGNAGDRESTHHVPMLWVFPPAYGIGPAEIAVPTAINDVAPTIYDLARLDWLPISNLTPIPGTFGKSLLPYLTGGLVEKATTSPDLIAHPRTAAEREREKREAEARLRALGYVQ